MHWQLYHPLLRPRKDTGSLMNCNGMLQSSWHNEHTGYDDRVLTTQY
jgi:hypothetical protein